MTLRYTYLAGLLAVLLLSGCDPEKPDPNVWFCDAETVEGEYFVSAGRTFAKGNTQSTTHAYEGDAACKVTSQQQYGMSVSLPNVKAGERFVATVWRYNPNGHGLIAASGGDLYISTTEAIEEDGDWQQLGIEFTVPEGLTEPMSVGVWMPVPDNDSAWFDDLTVRRIAAPTVPDDADPLRLELDETAMAKIEAKRAKALENGILIKEKDDWVRCELVDDFQYFEAKTRLKGDWTDHLKGNKWSFRIELRNKKEWNGMQEFSIQAPETRFNTHEWVWHELLRRENIISTRYTFRHVMLNTKALGLYAVEEHFGKPLLEAYERPDGIIIRFDETESWDGILMEGTGQTPGHAYFEACGLDAYGKPDKNMPEEWAKAKEGLMAFKFSQGNASQYFDAEKWAIYLASIDLLGAFHSFHWINLRMYYNPETGLIEPIGFDGFSSDGPEWRGEARYMAEPIYAQPDRTYFPPYLRYLLNDPELGRRYVDNLRAFTDADYLADLQSEIDYDTERINEMIEPEQPLYRFSWDDLHARAAQIREALNKDRAMLDQSVAALPRPMPTSMVGWPDTNIVPQENVSVKAWRNEGKITVACFAPQNVTLTATGGQDGSEQQRISGRTLPGYSNRMEVPTLVMPDQAGEWLYFEVSGRPGEVYKTPVHDEAAPPFKGL